MKRYKVIAADTKHFWSLYGDYTKTMRVVTPPLHATIAELETDTEFLTLLNGETAPDAYLININ